MIDSALLCHFHKDALPLLFVPVVGAVCAEETFRAGARIDLTAVALFGTSRTEIESPYRQPYAFRLSVTVGFGTEQPVGYLLPLVFGP